MAKLKKRSLEKLFSRYSCVAQYKPKKISKKSIAEICGIKKKLKIYRDKKYGRNNKHLCKED